MCALNSAAHVSTSLKSGSIFFDLYSDGKKIQAYIQEDIIGADQFKNFKELYDIGDFMEAEGFLFKTKKDE